MTTVTRRVQLVRRPVGLPTSDDIEIVSFPLSAPGPGEVLVENLLFSVDPYHREEMDAGWGLHAPWEGRSLGRVVQSAHSDVPVGALVSHRQAYTTHAVVKDFRVLQIPDGVSHEALLGHLGGTGMTAWVGLTTIAHLRPGERVLITSAAGAVGLSAGYIARALGASHIVGLTGSDEKATRLREYGPFDAVLNYRDTATNEILASAGTGGDSGFDVALDGVGGTSLAATISAMKDRGRIAWVGAIGQYLDAKNPPAAPANLYQIVGKELRLNGYLVAHHTGERPAFEEFMTPLIADGTIPVQSTVTEGLESSVDALRSVLTGGNFGKQLVRLAR